MAAKESRSRRGAACALMSRGRLSGPRAASLRSDYSGEHHGLWRKCGAGSRSFTSAAASGGPRRSNTSRIGGAASALREAEGERARSASVILLLALNSILISIARGSRRSCAEKAIAQCRSQDFRQQTSNLVARPPLVEATSLRGPGGTSPSSRGTAGPSPEIDGSHRYSRRCRREFPSTPRR